MDFTIPEELKQIQLLARKFVQEELVPLEDEIEVAGEFPKEKRDKLRKKARDLGLWSLGAPVEYGGAGLGMLGRVLVFEELGKTTGELGRSGGVIGDDRCMPFISLATEEQKKEFFIPVIKGERESCIALTEPDAGSDVRRLQTKAVKKGDNYILNGRKRFISAANRASFALAYAVTDAEKLAKSNLGVTCFLTDVKTPGFIFERRIPVLARPLPTYELAFDDMAVPAKNILGGLDQGLRIALSQVSLWRITQSSSNIGSIERLIDISKNYAKQRVTFGKPLAERQAIQWMLADMAIDLHNLRLTAYNLGWKYDQGQDTRYESYILKLLAAQGLFRAGDLAMQIHGGIGYTTDMVLNRYWIQGKQMRLIEGGDEIMKMMIARYVLQD